MKKMKKMMESLKRILLKNKGEMLIEAIVSILLLAILLTTVTAMIMASRRMTARSMVDARTMQEETFNPTTLRGPGSRAGTIRFTSVARVINVTHNVLIYEDDNIINAFYPTPPPPPPP